VRTVAFVFARGGSKGLPGKNLRMLAGRPLIAHSIDVARRVVNPADVYVSTDSEKIASAARDSGAQVIPRESELAEDDSPEWEAWVHAVEWVWAHVGPFDRFLSLPPTAPLRSVLDIESALAGLDDRSDFVVTMTKAARSPWFNMVRNTSDGLRTVLDGGAKRISRRQDAPTVYDLTTVAYVTRPQFILENKGYWDGRVTGVEVPPERAVDIDSELDLDFAEFLMARREKEGFDA